MEPFRHRSCRQLGSSPRSRHPIHNATLPPRYPRGERFLFVDRCTSATQRDMSNTNDMGHAPPRRVLYTRAANCSKCGLMTQDKLAPAFGDELGLGDRHHIVMTKNCQCGALGQALMGELFMRQRSSNEESPHIVQGVHLNNKNVATQRVATLSRGTAG